MRRIESTEITEKVKQLALDANFDIGPSFIDLLKEKIKSEKSQIGKNVLEQIVENDEIEERKSKCQDARSVLLKLAMMFTL